MRFRVALILLVAALAISLYATGAYTAMEPERLRAWLQGAGRWGGLLFVVAYSLLQPLGIRSIFFLLTAPLVWTPVTAFVLSWLGTVAASLVAFGFARFVGRSCVQRRLPQGIRRLDDRLAARGFRTVTLLRLIFYTAPTLQFALGVSRVRFAPFLLGTAFGVLPFTALMTALGAQINRWLAVHPISSWPWDRFGPLMLIAALAVTVLTAVAIRRWQSKLSFGNSAPTELTLEQHP